MSFTARRPVANLRRVGGLLIIHGDESPAVKKKLGLFCVFPPAYVCRRMSASEKTPFSAKP